MGFNLFDLLLPKEGKFFKFLDQQSQLLVDECLAFKNLLSQLEDLSEEEVKKRTWVIGDVARQGEVVENIILDELGKTFITPIDREDIHALAQKMDNAMEIVNATAVKISMYHIRKAPGRVCRFGEHLVNSAEELHVLLKLFEQKKVPYASIEKINQIQRQANELFRECVADLFVKEDNPLKLIKMKELYENLSSAVKSISDIAKLIRGIVVKQG